MKFISSKYSEGLRKIKIGETDIEDPEKLLVLEMKLNHILDSQKDKCEIVIYQNVRYIKSCRKCLFEIVLRFPEISQIYCLAAL